MYDLSKFPERLSEAMSERELTQSGLAKASGIAQPKLSFYLRGICLPDYAVFVRLVRFFGCSADYLLGGAEETCAVYKPPAPFPPRLRKILAENNISLYAFRKKTGASWSVIYKWLNGAALPSAVSLAKIAAAIDVTVDYLLGITE